MRDIKEKYMDNTEKSRYHNIIAFINDRNSSLTKKYSLDYLNIIENEFSSKNEDYVSHIQKLFIEQYSDLLNNALGGMKMGVANEVLGKLLVNLLSNRENIEQVKQITEIWNRKEEIIAHIFWEKLLNAGFVTSPDNSCMLKKINTSEVKDFQIVFYPHRHGRKYKLFFGFFNKDGFKKADEKMDLISMLDLSFSDDTFSKEPENMGEKWLIKRFLVGNCKKNISEVINEVIDHILTMEMLLRLEDRFGEVKNVNEPFKSSGENS